MNYLIVEGDSRNMFDIPTESVDLIFTSPPYFNVKKYDFNPVNIGNINNFDDYLKQIEKVFKECYRVLRTGCFIVVNISDIRSDDTRYNIPSHYSIMLTKLGFNYKEDIIWEKFAISSDKRFGITIQQAKPRYFYPNNVYEHTFVFMKGNKQSVSFSEETINIDYLLSKGFNTDVWHISPETVISHEHEAPFPEEYARLVVKLFSYKGEVVLDPFLGSGTTMLICKELGRNCIGYEINPEYVKMSSERCSFNQMSLNNKYGIKKQDPFIMENVLNLITCPNCGKEAITKTDNTFIEVTCEKCGYFNKEVKNIW